MSFFKIKTSMERPLIIYFLLACLITWLALLPMIGIDGFLGRSQPPADRMPLLFVAMCSGPLIAGLALTRLTDGNFIALKKTLLTSWRLRYSLLIFAAPFLMLLSSVILSSFSPRFLPTIFSSGDYMLIIGGIFGGLAAGICEEIGWTGFAIRKMVDGGVYSTGVIVGLIWGLWHFPLFLVPDPKGKISLLILTSFKLFTFLPAFRILLVWAFKETKSLILIIFMHMSLTAATLIFQSSAISGVEIIISNIVFSTCIILFTFLLDYIFYKFKRVKAPPE